MSRNIWTGTAVVALSATFISLGAYRHHLSLSTVRGAQITVAQNDIAFTIAGTLAPAVTTPIEEDDLQLLVPLGSFVSRGQVIGRAVTGSVPSPSGPTPQEAEATVNQLSDAAAAAEENLEAAQRRESDSRAQLALAQDARRATESELGKRDLQLREGNLSINRYYGESQRISAAIAAADSARTSVDQAIADVAQAERTLMDARRNLADAERARDRVNLAAVSSNFVSSAVRAPSSGYLVARDPGAGTYGIGADATELTVIAQVRAEDLSRIHTGQPAVVYLRNHPNVTLNATLREISEIPAETLSGLLYTVAFAVANPQDLAFTGESVLIRIPTIGP